MPLSKFFPESSPTKARAYVLLVIALGLPVLVYSLWLAVTVSRLEWSALALLTVLAGQLTVKIPIRGRAQALALTMGDIFIFSALLFYGPPVAVVLAAIEAAAIQQRIKIRRVYKFVFNLAQLSLVAFVVSHVFYGIDGATYPLDPTQVDLRVLLAEIGLCALLYFILNTGSIALGIGLTLKQSPYTVWKENFSWAWVTHLASAWIGTITFMLLREPSFGLIVAGPTVLLIYYALRLNRDRITHAQEHLQQVEELLQEKIQAEKALQESKEQLEFRVRERTAELRRLNRQLTREGKERKKAQGALAAEKERLDVTLRSLGEGVIATDTQGRIRLVNAEAEALTGWRQDEAEDLPLDSVFRLIREVDPSGEASDRHRGARSVLVSRNGAKRQISRIDAPIQGQGGLVMGSVLVFRDITYQSQMEEELLKAQKLESLGVLAGGIAHDFNNILAGILIKAQLAKRAAAREKDVSGLLDGIEQATKRASELTQQLLTFAKGGAPIKEAASLDELMQESAEFVLRGSKTRSLCRVDPDLWLVEIDRGQFNQVINNLVINADEAMPNGGTITLSAENVSLASRHGIGDLAPGDYVRLTVEDQGSGIAPKHLKRIFDPYFTTKTKGHGLGLASTYSVIRKHDGLISVESEVGRGTRFVIHVPASRKARASESVFDDTIETGHGRILIMDDEESIRQGAADLLDDLGYQTHQVEDGLQAIDAYRQALESGRPFDAAIMDLTIPGGMGGREAIQAILSLDPRVRAIVSSGYSDAAILSNYRDFGFRGILTKPFRLSDLSQTLHRVLAEDRSHRLSSAG